MRVLREALAHRFDDHVGKPASNFDMKKQQSTRELLRAQKVLGGRIRAERQKKPWLTQKAFAKACGMHPSAMGEIERGTANIRLSNLLRIAQKLKITVADLLEGI